MNNDNDVDTSMQAGLAGFSYTKLGLNYQDSEEGPVSGDGVAAETKLGMSYHD